MRPISGKAARVLIGAALIGAAAPSLAQPPSPPAETKAVLELFTSQGCSSCPPADKLLGQFTDEPGLITLSYSVDYWNYLGWRDTLSSAANSDRQREYARVRGDGRVYTPQVVVDGVLHENGSNEAAIEMAMRNAAKRLADVRVPVNMHAEGDTLVIGIGAAPQKSNQRSATVWLVIAKEQATVSVTRGENRGRDLTYHHPVRDVTPVGVWQGDAMILRLPLKDLKAMGGDCLVALVQVENVGPILGAAQYELL